MSFLQWLGLILLINCFGSYIISPICKCIYNCYRVKHNVYRGLDKEEYEKPNDFQDVDYE